MGLLQWLAFFICVISVCSFPSYMLPKEMKTTLLRGYGYSIINVQQKRIKSISFCVFSDCYQCHFNRQHHLHINARIQVMDDRWETEVIEYGAINITGFRIVDTSRRYVKEFLDGWKRLDPTTSLGAGKESISVSRFNNFLFYL